MIFSTHFRSALWFCCLVPAVSQVPPQQTADNKSPEVATRDAPSTFSSKVNLVSVPVVVRDSKGRAIGTLKKEDFQLFDKGKLQVISRFTVEKADGRVAPLKLADPDLDHADTPAGPPASRFVAYLFDDMHTSFGDLAQSRIAAIKYLATSMLPADRVAVFTTSGQNALDFTDDKVKLTEAMNRIVPRSRTVRVTTACPDVTEYMADLIQNKNDTQALAAAKADAVQCSGGSPPIPDSVAEAMARQTSGAMLSTTEADTQIAFSVLKATLQRMTAMPGQRTIVLVSSGFLVPLHSRHEELDIIDRAIRASVTISTLDARGLYTVVPGGDISSTQRFNPATAALKARYEYESAQVEGDVLSELAEGTGGTFFHNNNDLQEGFRRTGETPEFMYLLGFSPQNLKFDGSFHSIKVTAKEVKGVSLQARRGYYAPNHSKDPAEDAKEEIRVALFSRDEMSDIPVDLRTQFFKSTENNAKLSVLAHVDLKHLHFKKTDGRSRNTLSVVSAVFNRNGVLVGVMQKDIEMRLKDETLPARLAAGIALKTSFDVTPGSYIIRLVVRDSEGQTMAARNGVVEIP